MREALLVFSCPRRILRTDVAALSDVLAKQLALAAAKSFPRMTFDEAMAHVASNDCFWEYFSVINGKTPQFDVWLVSGDCGRFFHAGTTKDAGIFMAQSTFKATKRGREEGPPLDAILAAYVSMLDAKNGKKA